MNFKGNRPENRLPEKEEILIELAEQLHIVIINCNNLLRHDTLQFDDETSEKIAHALIEFAEDLNSDIGIWKTYEEFNLATFGSPLPCTLEKGTKITSGEALDESRIQHFLWNFYSILEPDLIFPPTHPDLLIIAGKVTEFLVNTKTQFPQQSTISAFLNEHEEDSYDVKRKLVWLGTKSYLFRDHFNNLLKNEKKKRKSVTEIMIADDFIMQIPSLWSGMGVIDILPDLLNIPSTRKKDIKSWYERHLAYYLIKSVRRTKLITKNIINNQSYHIIFGDKNNPFKEGDLILGSTIKYGSDWYWSGGQKQLRDVPENEINELRTEFIEGNTSGVIYRYDKTKLEAARNRTKGMRQEFIGQYGDDFTFFDSGISYLASIQKTAQEQIEKLSPEELEKFKTTHNLSQNSPRFNVSDEIVDCENGVAVYFNENEGQEILIEFDSLRDSLEKKGENMTKDEVGYVISLIEDSSISPAFVTKLIELYGTESIMRAYHIEKPEDIEYLLHKYKGHFYRERYPTLTLK